MIPLAYCQECTDAIYSEQDLYECIECKRAYCKWCWFNMERVLDGICDKCKERLEEQEDEET